MTLAINEYLTFILENEEYGVSILAVQEIKVWAAVTDMPNTPDYVKGVINLRGIIVPIVDLRQRLNKKFSEYNKNTVVIILKQSVDNKSIMVGIVVDAVSDVYKFKDSDIKTPPDFGTEIESQFISGMATDGDKIIVILDSHKLLDVKELYQISDSINRAAS